MLVSAFVTSVATAISFYIDYGDEILFQEKSFEQLQKVSLPAIARPLWDFDDKSVLIQLTAMTTIRDILKVQILSPSGDILHEVSKVSSDALEADKSNVDVVKEYLIRSPEVTSMKENLGTLKIYATRSFIIDKLVHRLAVFFVAQLVKSLMISALIYFLVSILINRRILNLSRYIVDNSRRPIEQWSKYSPGQKEIWGRDELSNLQQVLLEHISKLADLHQRNKKLILSQGEELDRQRQMAIESAKLVAVGEMASGIAHEINNPLSIVSLSVKGAELALVKKEPVEKIQFFLTRIDRTTQRISKIVNSMKLSVRDASIDPLAPVLCQTLIEECLILFESRLQNSGIELRTNIKDIAELKVECREGQVVQILVNLLNNAFDAVYQQKKPWIEVYISAASDGMVEISIIDSGKGLSPELASKIFNPFFTTKEVGKGTGLGLSIARKNAHSNGGDLFLDSQSSNTKFTLRLKKSL